MRAKRKEQEAESAAHDFVRGLSYSAIPLHEADGYLGKPFRKYSPPARTMPHSHQLASKYLPEVYQQHKEVIKFRLQDQKICVIADESPDVMGRPAVNTLLSYYLVEKNEKAVTLVDTSILRSCNSTSLALLLTKVLTDFGKDWNDVIGLASDSAEYMRKLVGDLRSAHNPKLLHIADVAHLVNVAVDKALHCDDILPCVATGGQVWSTL